MPNMDLYAALIAGLVGGSGGGGGGTSNYNSLSNKPQINGNTLAGNKTAAQLGLQTPITFDDEPTSGSSHAVRSGGVYSAVAQKVDKVPNKGLSSNDYTDSEKTKLAGIPQNAEANVITGITLNGEVLVPVNKIIAINVITKAVNDLTNYYLKSETYTKTEVDALINSISSLTLDIVEELPVSDISTTTIYLVPVAGASNVYMQYAYINNNWAQLGTTQIDLTNYYTKSQMDTFLLTKQDVLTFDNVPTVSSNNPVKSGGIYAALAGKQDTLTFDSTPTENSTNPVESGGVYDALSAKQDELTFDSEPTIGSTNPVTSNGVAEALQNVQIDIATEQKAGIVKPDGTSVTIDNDGTIHAAAGVVVDAVTNGDMHAVTSNAVYDELEKVRIVRKSFSGNTDPNGNVYIRKYNNDYIPIFASINNSGYTCYPIYWIDNTSFYVHVTSAIGGAAPFNLAVVGDIYYIKLANIR